MNYYIKGDAAKADQIKAAWEKLGIKASGYDFSRKDVLFFTFEANGKSYMMSAVMGTGLDNIILTHPDYKELELPVEPKFKVGDWVVKKDGKTFYGGNYAEQITLIEGDGFLKCIWFPSGTWLRDNDIRPWTIADAKDGDVLATNNIICIFKKLDKDGYIISPCIYTVKDGLEVIDDEDDSIGSFGFKPATKEDRELLFRKMQEAGYEWDEKKKELRRIIEPQFKVGDEIKTGNTIETIAEVDLTTRSYCCESGRTIWFENQDLWHLAPKPHYDIANFQPFDKVLVRQNDSCTWGVSFFGRYSEVFICCSNVCFEQCIPFNDDTKHLLGTTDMPSEEYINW